MLSVKNSARSALFTSMPKRAPVSLMKFFKAVSIRCITLYPSFISMGIRPKGPETIRSISDLSLVIRTRLKYAPCVPLFSIIHCRSGLPVGFVAQNDFSA
jgi:hypothetical protein